MESLQFDRHCRRCKRLANYLAETRKSYPDYFSAPVPSFGDPKARLLIVGLAPGLHGANATGRPFTGDYAGILLYSTLHKFGFSNKAGSASRDDGLQLINCRITNAVRCVPPQNKPVGEEVNNCNPFLRDELQQMSAGSYVLALGTLAHNAVLKALALKQSRFRFGHGHQHQLERNMTLVDSYHCSRYNTQTRRLTEKMFHDVFRKLNKLISK